MGDKKKGSNMYNAIRLFDLIVDGGLVSQLVIMNAYSVSCHNKQKQLDFQIARRSILIPICIIMMCTTYDATKGIGDILMKGMKFPQKSACRALFFAFMGVQMLSDPLFLALADDRNLKNAKMLTCMPPVSINPNGLYIGNCIAGSVLLLAFYFHVICAAFQVEAPN